MVERKFKEGSLVFYTGEDGGSETSRGIVTRLDDEYAYVFWDRLSRELKIPLVVMDDAISSGDYVVEVY